MKTQNTNSYSENFKKVKILANILPSFKETAAETEAEAHIEKQ